MSTARQRKQWRYDRETGRPSRMRGPEVVELIGRLCSYHDRGMSYRTMSEQAGVAQSVISSLRTRGDGIHRSNYEKLSKVRFEVNEDEGARMPTLAVRRRLGALWASGYSIQFMAGELGVGIRGAWIARLLRGEASWTHTTFARRVEQLYGKLADVDPLDQGMTKQGATNARNRARQAGHAPAHCWDPDTIDDPDAFPEWTGACGTPAGLRIHYRDSIPACPRCLGARERTDSNKGSSTAGMISGPRLKAVRQARGYSISQVAELLGVHRDTVYYWETSRSSPRGQEMLDRIITVLKCGHEDIREEST
jgi:DNA-binding transcriptional regulator YiaG